MDQKYVQIFIVATVIVCVTAKPPKGCSHPPLHVWPLGPDMFDLDIVSITRGTMGNVNVGSIPPALGYESTIFNGYPDSFFLATVDPGSIGDYAFQFYIKFDDVTQGTILSFESHSYDGNPLTTEIRKYRLEISNGDIVINVTDFEQTTLATNLFINTWYHIAFIRDKIKNDLAIYLDHSTQQIVGPISELADKPTHFPATVVIGQDIDGSNPLHGEMSCLQFVPCKGAIDMSYNDYCIPAAWPTNLPTTSTSTTTSISSTTTTTSSATTTSTTTAPMTWTSTTTSTTTTITSPSVTPTTAVEDYVVVKRCVQFEVINEDVTFGSPADILEVVSGLTTLDCVRRCNRTPSCEAFTFDGTICTLGVNVITVFSDGAKLYVRTL